MGEKTKDQVDLSKCGCDMVVAVSQKSLNATLKEYLDRMEGEEILCAYTQDYAEETGINYKEISYSNVVERVGMDLFDIPGRESERTPEQTRALLDAYNNEGFVLAFKMKLGLPDADNLSDLPDIITLLESDMSSIANVHYRMYLKEFHVIKIATLPGRRVIFTNLIQDPSKPWVFKAGVKLSFQDAHFDKLPQEIKDKLIPRDEQSRIKINDVLSIQQLYLDMNTIHLVDSIHLEGFSQTDELYNLFETGFLKNYVESFRHNGGVIFGYAARSFEKNNRHEIVVLENLNFYISPFYRNGKVDESRKDLYTLNYIFASPGKTLDLKKYANEVRWNWIEEKESSNIHGCMCVGRGSLATDICNHFADAAGALFLKPQVKASVNLVKYNYSFELSTDYSEPVKYSYYEKKKDSYFYKENEDSRGFYLKYSKQDSASDSYGNKVDVTLKYTAESCIRFCGNRIQLLLHIESYLDLDVDGGEAKGTIYDHTLSYNVQLLVNQEGKLIFVPDKEVDDHDNGTTINADVWLEILTFGTVDDCIKGTKEQIKTAVNWFKDRAIMNIKGAFSNVTDWVFPGGKVFTFKKAGFTDGYDTSADLTYATPED